MKLTFYGGTKQVTGCNYLLEEDDLKIIRVVLNVKPGCKNCSNKKCEFLKEIEKYLKMLKEHFKTYPEKPTVELSFDSKEIMMPTHYGADEGIAPVEMWLALEMDNGYTFKYVNIRNYYIPPETSETTKCIYA